MGFCMWRFRVTAICYTTTCKQNDKPSKSTKTAIFVSGAQLYYLGYICPEPYTLSLRPYSEVCFLRLGSEPRLQEQATSVAFLSELILPDSVIPLYTIFRRYTILRVPEDFLVSTVILRDVGFSALDTCQGLRHPGCLPVQNPEFQWVRALNSSLPNLQ